MSPILTDPTYVWAILLIFLLPILTIGLSELIIRLRRHENKYASFFELVRSILLPIVVAFILVRQVLAIPSDNIIYRVIISLFYIGIGYIGFLLFHTIGSEKDETKWENRIPGLFKTVLRILAILYPIYYLTGVWGIDLSSFVQALGVGSLVIAFALQDTLSSLVSGFLLVVDKPFAVGDWILADGVKGKVIDISWRSTRLQVLGNDVVVIPNLNLVSSSIHNFTMGDIGYRDELVFSFSYDDPPNQVKEVLLDMTLACPDIMNVPAPRVFTISYDDSSIGYKLIFNVKEFKGTMYQQRIRDDVMTRAYYSAERHGLTMPFPISVEYRREDVNPDYASLQQEAFEFLQGNHYFSILPEKVLNRVASEVESAPFAKAEKVFLEGYPSDGMYLVRSGEFALTIDAVPYEDKVVLNAGDILGEMVLLGRRSNIATCRALTDASTYRFSDDLINQLIAQYPRFAHEMNRLLEQRFLVLNREAL